MDVEDLLPTCVSLMSASATVVADSAALHALIREQLQQRMPVPRTLVSRNSGWWEDVVPTFTPVQFKAEFRVNRATFDVIVDYVAPYMRTQDTCFKSAVPVRKKVAIALVVSYIRDIRADIMAENCCDRRSLAALNIVKSETSTASARRQSGDRSSCSFMLATRRWSAT